MTDDARAPREHIRTGDLPELLAQFHGRLSRHRQEIDDLNVFPVPDGDTGSNLVATLGGALAAARKVEVEDPQQLLTAVSRGALRGACGNSGVIISQVVQALTDVLEDDPLDAAGLHRMLERGTDLAYEAVAEPVEGTMLTALGVARDRASQLRDAPLVEATEAVRDAVAVAVARTRTQLEVLEKAGVVDAGARGLEVVLTALHEFVIREEVELPAAPRGVAEQDGTTVTQRESGSSAYRFEVQYLLSTEKDVTSELRDDLRGIGDSVVVVANDGLVKVHVHTNDVGAAVELGQQHGPLSDIEVATFADQLDTSGPSSAARTDESPRAIGALAVLPGPGLRSLAEGVGAVTVHGAPGDLPNVATLLNAIGEVSAERVAVLPGHPNVVPTARQASAVSEAEGGRHIEVLSESDSPPAVLAALAVLAPDGDADSVLLDMQDAAAQVVPGEVVAAVRDADTPVGQVRRGQLLAIVDGEVVGTTDDPLDALRLVAANAGVDCEFVTLIVGDDVDESERTFATSLLEEVTGAEVTTLDGGQTETRYLIGFE